MSSSNHAIPDEIVLLLQRDVAQGRLILFTGSGFSLSARSLAGQPVASVNALREQLSAIAFPGAPLDSASSLQDLYQVALSQGQNRVGSLIRDLFTVDSSTLPDVYERWFSFPWRRIYTLNADTLADAAQRRFNLPRTIVSYGPDDIIDEHGNSLACVHINGRIDDFPDLTFGLRDYARRQALADPLYTRLAAELQTHPVLYVGTTLDEPPLWQYLEMRRLRAPRSRELRPRSYLVTPTLPPARAALLHEFNIEHIPLRQEEFAEAVLANLETERRAGLSALEGTTSGGSPLRAVHDLRQAQGPARADYLLGRDPSWTDVTDGFAVVREFEATLTEDLLASGHPLLVLTGTAGSGKSTTLMRLALSLDASGHTVFWLDGQDHPSLQGLRDFIRNAAPDVLAIDNADVYNYGAGPLIADLATREHPALLLVAMRGTRYEQLRIASALSDTPFERVSVPPLGDSDIRLLLDSLTRANRLGRLRGMTAQEQETEFRGRAGRQLLVALLSATSGRSFEERIESECAELPPEHALYYAIAALATHLGGFLTRAELMMAAGQADNAALNAITALERQHLLTQRHPDAFRVRHRLIADRAVDFYSRNGQLREPASGLLFALASETSLGRGHRRTRTSEMLVRLLSHGTLARLLSNNATDVRAVYAEVEGALGANHHFWLQRGSFEIEVGDLALAENYLNQSRAIEPADFKVDTAWGYLMLKKAAAAAPAPGSAELASSGINQLLGVIAARGDDDPYPHHILGSQGLSWVRRAALTPIERSKKLEKLLNVVGRARRANPSATDLEQLEQDLRREYLLTAVPEETDETQPMKDQLILEEPDDAVS